MIDSSSIKLLNFQNAPQQWSISEYIKTEKIFIKELRQHKTFEYNVYDQFSDNFIKINNVAKSEVEFIKMCSSGKNIIYINRPVDIEKFVREFIVNLPRVKNTSIDDPINDISDFLDKDYLIVQALRRGVVYHHASIPDNIKLYIEFLYSTIAEIRFIVTTSTLLEGVNVPAEKIFLLSNYKGKSYLSSPQLKNLIGRVCRFNELFSTNDKLLSMLVPSVYFVVGKYFKTDGDVEKDLRQKLKIGKKYNDKCKNVLLEHTKINNQNEELFLEAINRAENIEKGSTGERNSKILKTDVGKLCIANNVTEFDIFQEEISLDKQVKLLISENNKIETVEEVLELIAEIFIKRISDRPVFYNIRRLLKMDTRRFYSFYFKWKMEGSSYKRMISAFLARWAKRVEINKPYDYVGRWGEFNKEKPESKRYRNWVWLTGKSHSDLVNLAIVRIKEEQEFVENNLQKFIEVLNGVGLMEESLYKKIKYGTLDENLIIMIRCGFSLTLATALVEKYSDYWYYNLDKTGIVLNKEILKIMQENEESGLLLLETQYNVF